MRFVASLGLALAATIFMVGFLGLVAAHAADAVTVVAPAATTQPVVFQIGDAFNWILGVFGGTTVVAGILVHMGMLALARVNKPLADAAAAAGIDKEITTAVNYALAALPGMMAGKKIELDHLPNAMATSINFVQDHSGDVVDAVGGTVALKKRIMAKLSEMQLVDPNASTASFS